MLSDSSLLRVPGGVVFHHGMKNRQQLAHAGRQRDLRGLPRRPQALIKRFEYRIIAHRHEGTHVQGGPHVGASPPEGAGAPEGAAVTISRCHPNQGSQPLAAQRAQRWEVKQQRAGTDRANARHTAEQLLALTPDRTRAQGGVQVVVERR
jgi:hypothetical protein